MPKKKKSIKQRETETRNLRIPSDVPMPSEMQNVATDRNNNVGDMFLRDQEECKVCGLRHPNPYEPTNKLTDLIKSFQMWKYFGEKGPTSDANWEKYKLAVNSTTGRRMRSNHARSSESAKFRRHFGKITTLCHFLGINQTQLAGLYLFIHILLFIP